MRSNGFYPEELGNFFESADALDHWHGPLGLDALYRQSILESDSTGDFLEAIYSAEPDYIKFISNKVDCLLAERNQLLAAAGGTLKHPNVVGATISSSAFFLSCFIAYKTRGSWLPTLSKGLDVVSGWFTNREVATVNNDLDSTMSYEIKTINNPYRDIFKYAIEPVVPKAQISGEQLRRDRLRFREDPTSFFNDMVKSHPEIFDLSPAGFKADLKYGYTKDIAQAQTYFNKQVDEIAKAYYKDWFQSNNPQHSAGKVIQQEEIKVAKQTLLNAAKANNDGERMSPVFQWFQAKDERQRLLLLLEADKKLIAQVNEGDGKYKAATVVQELMVQFGGQDKFNDRLRSIFVAIKDSEDKLKELDELIKGLDFSPEVRLLIAKDAAVDPPEIIRAAEEQYKQLEAAYKVFLNCMNLDRDINSIRNNLTNKVTHCDIDNLLRWKANVIETLDESYGPDIANFVKDQYPAGSYETRLEGDVDIELDDYLYKQIRGMLNLKPGQSIDADLANYLKDQAIEIINELDAEAKGEIVDYYNAVIDGLS